MYFYFLILFTVTCLGVLGLKDNINPDIIYKNIEEIEKVSSLYGAVTRSKLYGGVSLGINDVVPNRDAGILFNDKFNLGLSGNLENSKRGLDNYQYNIDDGNPDIHGNVLRPCQVYDTFCIRKFFAEHSMCKISGRAVPEPLFRAQLTNNYPHTNMSVTQRNIMYSGFSDGIISEFYINTVTDNLIISIDFPAVTILSNQTAMKFYMKGREPAVNNGPGNSITYGASELELQKDWLSIYVLSGITKHHCRDVQHKEIRQKMSFDCSATVIIPHLKNLRLDRAEILLYTDTITPQQLFAVGPGLILNTDPGVLLMLTAFLTTVPLDNAESSMTEIYFYANNFIQYNICDFGLEIL